MRCARVVLLALGLLAAFVAPALAAPLEELVQLAVHPADPNVMVLRYEYGGEGLVFSDDAGATWRPLCAGAMQASGLDRPPSSLGRVIYAEDGSLYMGIFGAMLKSDATGCTWATDGPFADLWVSDVTRHPSDPSVLFAVTSSGGADKTNGVYRKTGTGAWEAIGTQEAILIGSVHVAEMPGGGLRIYESAARGIHCGSAVCDVDELCCNGSADASADPMCGPLTTPCEFGPASGATPNYMIRVSDDLGQNWTEHPFPDVDGTVRIEAVDPTDPERIVVSVVHTGGGAGGIGTEFDTLHVSSDGGASFAEWTTVRSFGGLSLAADGRVWIGDLGDPADATSPKGLSYAAGVGETPTLLNDESAVSCVHYLPTQDKVLTCRRFDAALADPTTGAYAKSFDFRETEEMLDCPDKAMCDLCERQYLIGWCGITHFPEAPMCCCYSDEDRLMDPNYTPGNDPGVTLECGGGMGTAGTTAGSAGTTAGTTGGAGATAGTTGTAGTTAGTTAGSDGSDPGSDDGGCACGVVGDGRHAPAPFGLLLLAVGLGLGLTRRRRRAPGPRPRR